MSTDKNEQLPENNQEHEQEPEQEHLHPEDMLDGEPEFEDQDEDLQMELPEESQIEDALEKVQEEEMEFISDKNAALLMKTPTGGRFLIYTMLAALLICITWASLAPLAEVTRGMGVVVPSQRLQVVQNLEGGILEEIYVQEGQQVKKGEPLLRLDDTRFTSSYRESAVEYYSELAKAARLQAELSGQSLKFPPGLEEHQDYIVREKEIFEQRSNGLKAQLDIANKQASQAKHELAASRAQLEFLETSLELGEEELELTRPLARQGVVSKVELIQLKQRVNDLASDKAMTELSLPKLKAAYQESVARKKELTLQFREEVVQELKETEVRLDQLTESHSALQDKVVRTLIRSPLDGIVKKIHINTISGVVQPGADLMEIVPVEDNLLVEVQISPKDIGFLREGMKSVVKLTAYDFAIYGGLEGTLEHISADTIKDDKGESFYVVRIRTTDTHLGTKEKPLEIIPGMRTNVDIITGEKTLMEYLLKPILKAKQNALTER